MKITQIVVKVKIISEIHPQHYFNCRNKKNDFTM